VNLKTVEAYLQGKYHLDKFGNGSGEEELLGAKEYFQQAIDADPDFAPAYVGMASVYDLALHPSTEDRKLERRAAEKAVELDPTSSDGLIMLAEVNSIDLDWQRIEQEYRRAILLNPNSASAHQGLCEFLAEIGRLQEAWGECQTAQVLDPNNDHLSLIMYLRGNHDGAIELLLRWSELHPNNGYAHLTLHRWYAMKGIYKESIQHLEQGLILYGYPHIARRVQTAFAVSGYRGAMREFVTQIEDLHARNEMFSPITLAQGYAALGDKDRAFYWLNRAYEDRARASGDPGLCWLKVYPMLDPLRSDPRYRDLLRRVGFPTQPFS
jgi:tetratricopeptide (TPR) repeat protein